MDDFPETVNDVSNVAMHLADDLEGAACLLLTAAVLNAVHGGLSLQDVQARIEHDYKMLEATRDAPATTLQQ